MSDAPDAASPPPIFAGLKGCCPRCGARTLFAGWIRFAPSCRACGLDFERFNVGDGAAAFLTLILGALICGLAIWLELAASPPWWVHALIWPPLTLALLLGSLRLTKGVMLALEYHHRAGEGRLVKGR